MGACGRLGKWGAVFLGSQLGVRVVQSEIKMGWNLVPGCFSWGTLTCCEVVSQVKGFNNGTPYFFLPPPPFCFLVSLWSWDSTATITALGCCVSDYSHSTLTLLQAAWECCLLVPLETSILLLCADEMCHVKLCTKLKQDGNNPLPI